MTKRKHMDLFDKSNSIQFYNDRYKEGYMEDWPLKKKHRIKEIIKSMNLPEKGEALDYGCGNGVFTAVIKEALPQWNVFGSDISEIAIENAAKRYSNCSFYVADNKTYGNKKFDFIFSHHVLEHVYDIDKSCEEIALLSNPEASILHILPCGNEGSLEYKICSNRIDGINKKIQNRFFYEDPGHLRRLKSNELAEKYNRYHFNLSDAYFSNQYYGALDWITNYDAAFIKYITDKQPSKGFFHGIRLLFIRYKLLILFKAKSIERFYQSNPVNGLIAKIKLSIAKKITGYYMKQADMEWASQSKQKNGSEMFICLKHSSI